MDFKKFVMPELYYIVPTSTPVHMMVKGKHPDPITYDKRVLTNLSITCDYDAMYNSYQFMLRWTKKGSQSRTIAYNFAAELIAKGIGLVKSAFQKELLKSTPDKYERHAVNAFLDKAFEHNNPLDGWVSIGYTSDDTPVGGWLKKNGGLVKAPGGNVNSSSITWDLNAGEIKFFGGPVHGQSYLTKNEMKALFEKIDTTHQGGVTIINNSSMDYVDRKSRELPGMMATVVLPCSDTCTVSPSTMRLRDAIMHLNDKCKWSRERIADWLDDLHDTGQVNLEFDPWKEETDDDTNAGKD